MSSQNNINTSILFDGYCPACMLKGKQSELKINEMDFWMCLENTCRLQLVVLPPFATILPWRGKGSKFKSYDDKAADQYKGLLLTKAIVENGVGVFPDKNGILDSFNLDGYLQSISDTEEEFKSEQFDPNDPVFEKQAAHLEQIATEEWENLINLYTVVHLEGLEFEAFTKLHQMLYDLRIIFDFKWAKWEGQRSLNEVQIDYSSLSLLDISKYMTLIARQDRFDSHSLKKAYDDGVLDMLFERLEQLT